MRKLILAGVVLLGVAAPLTDARAQSASPHSENMSLVANWNNHGEAGQGSDMAFWGNRAVLGNYAPGGFWLMDITNAAAPAPISFFDCPGTQADVSIWRDLVVVSVDSARGATDDTGAAVKPEDCGAVGASQAEIEAGTSWEGLRLVSIADPKKPVQIGTVKTDCGSHTHTLYPDQAHGRLLAYILSYPLGAPSPTCNAASHRKISIVEIPIANPTAAKVIGTADVSPNIGCHDVTVFPARKIAAAGCISESQIWDLSDPAKPVVIAHIPNPENNIHHSASFSWDGNIVVLGDELGGAEAAPGCVNDNGRFGGLWFYDVKDPKAPVLKGSYRIPQRNQSALCSAHLFNTVPLRSEKNVLIASWYEGGTTVVDFTDPTKPQQIAFYIPMDPTFAGDTAAAANQWSAYWYNGHGFANNLSPRGFDIFAVKHPFLDAEIEVPYLNPQVQEPLPAPKPTAAAPAAIVLPPAATAKCTKRTGFRLTLKAPRGQRLRSAVIFVGGRRAKFVRGKALRRPVRLTKLPSGRTRIDVTLRTAKGKRIQRSKTYRFC
jgi:hypothetical protein